MRKATSAPPEFPEFDIIVVGMGLAGAAAAIGLAQRGARVLALEGGSFPRHKVCGEFLSSESRATLARLHVLDAMLEAGARDVCRTRIFAPHHASKSASDKSSHLAARPIEADLPAPGLALSRWELDQILFERALACGVQVEQKARVSGIESLEEGWKVTANGHGFTGKYLVATVGRHAPWWEKSQAENETRFVGLKAHFEDVRVDEGVSELHAWSGGYCGLMRVEGAATNACLLARYDSLGGLRGRAPGEFWSAILEQQPVLRERMVRARALFPWMATANVSFPAPTPLRRLAPSTRGAAEAAQVMCAGDAAGFIHPLTGDGMAMALRGGELAGATIWAALQNAWPVPELNALWQRVWEREFSSRLRWARPLQAALIEPRLSRLVEPIFSHAPSLVQLVVRRTRG